MNRKHKIVALGLALILCLGLVACSPKESGKEPEEGSDGLTKVQLVLDYKPNTNHTGFYVAQKLGYFAEEGLEVSIIEPAEGAVTTLISAGKGDFGISYQEDVTYARTAAEPLPIRAIAAIIQHNTSGFASYEPKGITRPLDFEGKTYSGWGAPSEEAVIKAVMTADGGDFSKLSIVSSGGGGYAELQDKVDLKWFFWAWDGIAAERQGLPINYIELRSFDERLDYYTPVVIASEKMLAEQPELTKKFLNASSRGYQYAIENPEEAANILFESTPEYELDYLIASQQYLAEKYAEDAPRWGEMKESVWENYTDFMLENSLIEQSIAPADCYTNEFLPQP